MGLCILHSRAPYGIQALEVIVEVQTAGGLPALSIVGLPEMAVRESKDRVRGALRSGSFQFPDGRVTINLAPADLPKEGGRFDLPIALGILGASGQLQPETIAEHEFVGELALSGALRPVSGVLPSALAARDAGRTLVLPAENADEASLVRGLRILPARHLLEICHHLNQLEPLAPYQPQPVSTTDKSPLADLAEVRGQPQAKRALEIAAAGAHSLLFIGPPGTGKSMLASRLPGILPPLTEDEALQTAAVRSVVGRDQPDRSRWRERPFRAPHHTASGPALVGGGSHPRPGEISLAHHGVLFLDELPEFDRRVLEVLREPMETGRIHISRAARQAEFPARFQLLAAMNPCPCGHLGDPSGRCHCTAEQVARYRGRISGPLLDRIDMQLDVPRLAPSELTESCPPGESSTAVRERVCAARARAEARSGGPNSHLQPADIDQHCQLDTTGRKLIGTAMQRLALSARAYHRILKLARTIADLDDSATITPAHLSEAIGYRRLDRGDLADQHLSRTQRP
ncbi:MULTISPECIES: YifB family Mg chelatase-like AAA ATPase [Thiorhodovibrio]|uniref:YifB family Mg chelatase-like AAA ATPase n=1 Tax=Thiorhodovibrio TaxID=61593 RepID=UPI0019138299|nr:YifB family Mg chelatase-like AAA ATPase [Thiorhodovibrio litoralis]MBK5970055.1 ATP-dependent protease [Thiorhodovibrio winogradskyi]WPL12981.1 Competence protein ComM [Thiorhodovibrio litoralis]